MHCIHLHKGARSLRVLYGIENARVFVYIDWMSKRKKSFTGNSGIGNWNLVWMVVRENALC